MYNAQCTHNNNENDRDDNNFVYTTRVIMTITVQPSKTINKRKIDWRQQKIQ